MGVTTMELYGTGAADAAQHRRVAASAFFQMADDRPGAARTTGDPR
jgi:hypothetical protein